MDYPGNPVWHRTIQICVPTVDVSSFRRVDHIVRYYFE